MALNIQTITKFNDGDKHHVDITDEILGALLFPTTGAKMAEVLR